MSATLAEPDLFAGEQGLVLHAIEWKQYVAINDALPERRGVRMIYIDGSLTLLTLSRRHDWLSDHLDKIVMAVALGCGIEREVAGSATFRLEAKEAGVEGDRTYYFGDNAAIMAGPIDIDLTTQPPPDLAIEVEVTHPADKAIATYARIGVPEVWRYHAPRRTLAFLVLGEDGTYRPATRSRNLPGLTPEDVLEQLRLADEIRVFSRWYAQLTEWVRLTLLPRADGG
jgi:Uma2 family endonuclease